MQNVSHVRKSLYIDKPQYTMQKFFCEYFGVVFTHFYIFINVSGIKRTKTARICVCF